MNFQEIHLVKGGNNLIRASGGTVDEAPRWVKWFPAYVCSHCNSMSNFRKQEKLSVKFVLFLDLVVYISVFFILLKVLPIKIDNTKMKF